MARLIFENISLKDAKIFVDWYEGQGEQNADIWFEENGSTAPLVDVGRKGWLKVDKENDTVTVQLRENET